MNRRVDGISDTGGRLATSGETILGDPSGKLSHNSSETLQGLSVSKEISP